MNSNHYKIHLRKEEEVLFESEKHIITRLMYHFLFIAVTVFSVVWLITLDLSISFYPTFYILLLAAIGIAFLMAYFLIWSILLARRGLILTNHRIIHMHHGLFSRDIESIPYEHITDIHIHETFLSHFFNIGTVKVLEYQKEVPTIFYLYEDIDKIEAVINEYIGNTPPPAIKKTAAH